jgi:hypothetical protein
MTRDTAAAVRLILAPIGLCLLASCGSCSDHARVGGTASYDGKPIELGTIERTPADGTKGPATGSTIHGGQWAIAAEKGPLRGGTYLVRITGMKNTGKTYVNRDRPKQPPADVMTNCIPATYNAASTRKITIPADAAETRFDFDLPHCDSPPVKGPSS